MSALPSSSHAARGPLFFLTLALLACSPMKQMEICGNGLDDDNNGSTDCLDVACSATAACLSAGDAGYYGPCAKCGNSCQQQSECMEVDMVHDWPLPTCSANHCSALIAPVEVRFELNMTNGWGVLGSPPRSTVVRFIKRTSPTGAAVTCNSIKAIAGATAATANAIEGSNAFVLQGLDIYPLTGSLPTVVTLPFIKTTVGAEYIVWVEFWAGSPDATTRYPQGIRYGYGCFDSTTDTAALQVSDNCPSSNSDAGTCRTFRLTMPGPM